MLELLWLSLSNVEGWSLWNVERWSLRHLRMIVVHSKQINIQKINKNREYENHRNLKET